MAKDRSIIRQKVKKISETWKASQDNPFDVYYAISEMLFDIVDIADRSIHCESHRKILDDAIIEFFGE